MKEKSVMKRIEAFTEKIAGPLATFADRPAISSIQAGMVQVMPLIIIGSLFLIIGILGQPLVGDSGEATFKFLEPYATKLMLVNDITLGFLGFYVSYAVACNYAEKLAIDAKTGGLIGLVSFMVINIDQIVDGTIQVKYFGAAGLFVGMITSLLMVRLYKYLIDKKITIKMPREVPPNVSNAFTSLIPFAVVIFIIWFFRTLIGIDFNQVFEQVLSPFITAADNIWMYTFKNTLDSSLWSIGLHGGNILAPIFDPMVQGWSADNALAVANGQPIPHIWVGGLDRLNQWVSVVWPLLILLFFSKVKGHRAFAIACIPAAFFGIVEPVIFGLPLAYNPFLMIPMIIITAVTAFITYGVFAIGMISPIFIQLPWATPAPLLGVIATGGDLMVLPLIALNMFVGYIIYLPFFRAFEKSELKRVERMNDESTPPNN